MTRLYISIGIILLTLLLGVGAFWQHGRYVALNQQFESLQEAHRGLAEASKKAQNVSEVKEQVSHAVSHIVVDGNKRVRQSIEDLNEVVEKGNTDEKAIMSSPLPVDVVRVLDNAYRDRDKSGDAP